MHEARQGTEIMNLKELNDLFNEGRHYIDYTLNEYEFCRYFLTQANPKTIKVIGGFTNINLFYASQDLDDVEVTNYDPGEVDMGSHIWSKMFDHYKQIFNFKGTYNWIPKTILNYRRLARARHTITRWQVAPGRISGQDRPEQTPVGVGQKDGGVQFCWHRLLSRHRIQSSTGQVPGQGLCGDSEVIWA